MAVLPWHGRAFTGTGDRRARHPGRAFFYRLQLPIHGGRIIGLTGQVMIAVLGILIAVLSGTGIYIWWRKLLARRSSKARKSEMCPIPD
ncbi:PepSY domain-containing protein [Pseudomonas lini]